MSAARNYAAETIRNIQQALEQMPLRPADACHVASASMPQTSYDIERYVHALLAGKAAIEQKVSDVA